jgi:hypothetical protein
MQQDFQRLEREVQRVHTRYQIEVVEAFGLCPWAKEARKSGRVHMHVTFTTVASPEAALALIDTCMQAPQVEVSMLIWPLLPVSRRQFAHFVAAVRAADEARSERGQQRFALADFHPNAPADLTDPAKLVPFLRRAPDPLIQIVRTDVLARVRGDEPHGTSYVDPERIAQLTLGELAPPAASVAARVAQQNLRTAQRVGFETLTRVFDTIQADRAESYAACGVDAPTHAHIPDTSSAVTCNNPEKPLT